jgi:hypothetical protein
VKRVPHSFWLDLATKARASFKIDQLLINGWNSLSTMGLSECSVLLLADDIKVRVVDKSILFLLV